MRKYRPATIAVLSLVLCGAPHSARAQDDVTATINHIANAYILVPNITYRTVSNWEAKLDVIQPRGLAAPEITATFPSSSIMLILLAPRLWRMTRHQLPGYLP